MLAVSNPTSPGAPGEKIALEPRLVRAAHEFEAQMMKELLKPMSRAPLEETEGEDTGVLGEFASESLARALSAGGGLGIADRIVHDLSRSENFSGASGRIQEKQKTSFSK